MSDLSSLVRTCDLDDRVGVTIIESDSESDLSAKGSYPLELNSRRKPSKRVRRASETLVIEPACDLPTPVVEKNPASILKTIDLLGIKLDYGLSESIFLRVPLPGERADGAGCDEIVVYKDFFASGLREVIPSLVIEVAALLKVSPGQFSPTMWATLIAIQAFGELFSVEIGLDAILYAYSLRNCSKEESRFKMHPRQTPLVRASPEPLDRDWKKRYLFMKVSTNPGFPISWHRRVILTGRCESGESKANKVTEHPVEHRCVEFLTSEFVLPVTTIRGYDIMANQPGLGDRAFQLFMKAGEAKLNKSEHSQGPTSSDDALGINGKRKTPEATTTLSITRGPKATYSDSDGMPLSSQSEAVASLNPSASAGGTTKSELSESLKDVGMSVGLERLQSSLQTASTLCHHLQGQSSSFTEELKHERHLVAGLRQELSIERESVKNADSAIASKDACMAKFERKVEGFEAEVAKMKADYITLGKENSSSKEELRQVKDSSKEEVVYAESWGMVVARWELMRDWVEGKSTGWDLVAADREYRQAVTMDAKIKGLEPPTFGAPLDARVISDPIAPT
ncbi:unnamed protein product [Microthlaspi erraticum]|uniref:Uncharacterized protein n=1 Tax=Microthlaspi erraticum TaxID=1685480 RepID=A0A6D2KGM3_9BRAS|nr:unnamed protein product [Microthlaspi erraticum]